MQEDLMSLPNPKCRNKNVRYILNLAPDSTYISNAII